MSSTAQNSAATAAAPAASAATVSDNGPTLVPADTYDFLPGAELFVRGQPAVCVRFDYPHVYWQWASDVAAAAQRTDGWEAPEKHRSCSASPQLFSVRAESKRSADEQHGQGHDGDHHTNVDTSDEDDDDERDYAERQRAQQQQQQQDQQQEQQEQDHEQASNDAPVADASADSDKVVAGGAGARASLMSMFARRPDKSIISGLVDAADESISARAPQSVSIERCIRTRFTIGAKISQLTLLECEDIDVTFYGVISSVELIRCKRCTLRNTQGAQTYTLDDTEGCSITFPGRQDRVLFVSTTSSARNVLTAAPSPLPSADIDPESDQKQPADIDTEVQYTIEPPAAAATSENTPAPVPSGSEEQPHLSIDGAPAAGADASAAAAETPSTTQAAHAQIQTTWSAGAFNTKTLARQGPLGYFANN